jgi:AcrR family transcriptional regulator
MNQLVHKSSVPVKRGRLRRLPSAEAPARVSVQFDQALAHDPDPVKADILQAAIAEFGEKGLAGARVDAIAAATRTSKRMIYYYFGSKDALYLSALEASYRRVRQTELGENLDSMPPVEALRCLVAVTFDHHLHNESYIRMVMAENINRGRCLAKSPHICELNRPAIDLVRRIYERGVGDGVFRPGLEPADIHASISALAFFNVSNRHTFGLIFQIDNQSPTYIASRRENIIQTVLRYVLLH